MLKNKKYLKIIAERIKEIRLELDFNYNEISELLNVPYHKYTRMEKGQGANIDFFIHYLNFAAEKNYNLNWILKEDNSGESKKQEDLFFLAFDREAVNSKLSKSMDMLAEIKHVLEDV